MTYYVIEAVYKAIGIVGQLAMTTNKNLAEELLEKYQKHTEYELRITEYQFDSFGVIIFE